VTLHHSMCSLHFTGFLLATLLSAATSAARADDWARPQTKEMFSASREYFVRVIPGESLGDTFGFAREKKGKYAAAEFYRRQQDRSYRLVAETVLLNPVAPVEFFVSNDGVLRPSITGITSDMARSSQFMTLVEKLFSLTS
jgi:hypothetical protein